MNVPNLSPVPENCKHLVNEDDILYVVPGDGNCAPNCAAAFLFNDEIYGAQLRRVMNVFLRTTGMIGTSTLLNVLRVSHL